MTDNKKLDPAAIAQMANAKAKGKRPNYFDDPMQDTAYSVTLALAAELAAARERIDTLERLLVESGVLDANAVDSYEPDEAAGQARQTEQMAYSARIFRPIQQALEELEAQDLNMAQMANVLGDKN